MTPCLLRSPPPVSSAACRRSHSVPSTVVSSMPLWSSPLRPLSLHRWNNRVRRRRHQALHPRLLPIRLLTSRPHRLRPHRSCPHPSRRPETRAPRLPPRNQTRRTTTRISRRGAATDAVGEGARLLAAALHRRDCSCSATQRATLSTVRLAHR